MSFQETSGIPTFTDGVQVPIGSAPISDQTLSHHRPDGGYDFYVLYARDQGAELFAGNHCGLTSLRRFNSPFVGSTSSRAGEPREARVFGYRDDNRRLVLRFFKAVNAELKRTISDREAPLVMVGDEHLIPLFRASNSHRTTLYSGLQSWGDDADLSPLWSHSQRLVADYRHQANHHHVTTYRMMSLRGRACDQLMELGHHAVSGMIDTLLIRDDARVWGQLDPISGQITLPHVPQSSDNVENLLQTLARVVTKHGGKVVSIEGRRMPTQEPTAAILRVQEDGQDR